MLLLDDKGSRIAIFKTVTYKSVTTLTQESGRSTLTLRFGSFRRVASAKGRFLPGFRVGHFGLF